MGDHSPNHLADTRIITADAQRIVSSGEIHRELPVLTRYHRWRFDAEEWAREWAGMQIWADPIWS